MCGVQSPPASGILWNCTGQSESQPYSRAKFNSAETLFYVLSKSFPENSIFAKVYICQQYQTFFSNIRRKCKVQNQTYSFAKFNSAKKLFYVLSIAFPENSFFLQKFTFAGNTKFSSTTSEEIAQCKTRSILCEVNLSPKFYFTCGVQNLPKNIISWENLISPRILVIFTNTRKITINFRRDNKFTENLQ